VKVEDIALIASANGSYNGTKKADPISEIGFVIC